MHRHEVSMRRLFEAVWNGADPEVAADLDVDPSVASRLLRRAERRVMKAEFDRAE